MSLQAEKLLEIGLLYCDRGDYKLALPNLEEASKTFLEEKNYRLYLKTLIATLRIHSERADNDKINSIKEHLHDMVIREGIELSSQMYYVLGLCSSLKGQPENAIEYLKKALELGLKANNKEDMCYAILGLSICYRQLGRFEEALKEIYNLNIFLQVINNTELKIASANSNARILIDMKKYEPALDILWMAYEEIKYSKQLYTALGILINIGTCLYELGQKDAAKVYFGLAFKSIDPENNRAYFHYVEKYMKALNSNSSSDIDMVFDLDNHAIVEKSLGKIDFKNQFILLDLLKLFISNQGQIFSKEYLVEQVWKQNYDPEVHDNKIYVTIKRLRKMIEPDYDKPKYIFRAKNGYYLSKTAKVEMNESKAEGALK
jgi:tetratricopeptide (TPR) repeat protein